MSRVHFELCSNCGSYEEGILPSYFNMLQFQGVRTSVLSLESIHESKSILEFINAHPDQYILGFIGYDWGLDPAIHKASGKITGIPDAWLMAVDQNQVIIDKKFPKRPLILPPLPPLRLKQMTPKTEYVSKVATIKEHIQQGDIYELNYCIPFVCEEADLDIQKIWTRLNHFSPMPFAALLDTDDFAIISASPERFMRKKSNHLWIQPMKGTMKKGKNAEETDQFKKILQEDEKERSENVMIVDLTRNDLSKLALKGSVKVDELFGVYEYASVLQMISTIHCDLRPGISFGTVLEATFPMGSMTGAPKRKAMELIARYESFSRGPFSGMLGYIDPQYDFDFNVLIRTLFYDKRSRKLFLAVGSAITSQSNVEKEYEECFIKLQPLLKVLNASIV